MLILAQASSDWPLFLVVALIVSIALLLWDTIEVGRNDAANLVNAVFGSRVLTRRAAACVAAVGVVLGASASRGVIETARKGIFDPGKLAAQAEHADAAEQRDMALRRALSVYIAVYVVDTVLLFGYSAFGMPISTTACLVFELLGAAFALGGAEVVNFPTARKVILAIILSIVCSGIAAFMIQRAVRGAIRDRTTNLTVLLAHGGWIGGGMLAALCYFMLRRGMKYVPFVQQINETVVATYGEVVVVLGLWGLFALLIHVALVVFGNKAARLLFPSLAVIGTLAMAFAFGQNDLANCAAPGLSAANLIFNPSQDVAVASEIPIEWWALIGCGILMAAGMFTRNAQRVTSAAIHAGSMAHNVRLWAPGWCLAAARVLLRFRGRQPTLAPAPTTTADGKMMHYDVLRACVILAVSASVIATASGMGMPVSTTYVAFAAVIATGMADRILQRGDADLKLARTLWVVFSWFASALIAAVCAGLVCLAIYHLQIYGIVGALAVNLAIRRILKKRGDAQEQRVREAARERMHPERYAEDYEG